MGVENKKKLEDKGMGGKRVLYHFFFKPTNTRTALYIILIYQKLSRTCCSLADEDLLHKINRWRRKWGKTKEDKGRGKKRVLSQN